MLKEELSVIIICYDPYEDAIKLNPYFFDKYWPDCDLDVIYVTSNAEIQTNKLVLKTNGDLSYCKRLRIALNAVKTEYVLLLLDDYFLNKRIDEKLIENNIDALKETSRDYCELFTMFDRPEGEKLLIRNTKFVKVSAKRKYRITLQPAIFSKRLLEQLLSGNPRTAWDAELIFMNKEFDKYDALFSLNKSFSITNYIDKGLMTKKGYKMLKNEGLWNNQRPIMPLRKTLKKWFVRKIYRFVPQKWKDKFKSNGVIYKG